MLLTALLATLALSGCDRPAVVAVPGPTVAVPGPAGPLGATVVQVEHRDRDVHEDRHETVNVVQRPEEHRNEAVTVDHGNTSVTVEKHDPR
jgi:hypothetical protein